ncbi:MAG: TetR/AcrR family transcriptional regulator [Cyclobacteriaceae bacterium]
MEDLLQKLKIEVNENIYLKDPFSSDLGKDIIASSIILIKEVGIEHFTFKKLSEKIGSTESAIYRYFDNKHRLLFFLVSWYWGFLEHNLVFATANLDSPYKRLEIAIKLIVKGPLVKSNDYMNLILLQKLVVDESLKIFMTKEVDEEYKNGFFSSYSKMMERITSIISEINPNYTFPKTLVSTLIQSSILQAYYTHHLPAYNEFGGSDEVKLEFFMNLVFNALKNEN